MKSVALGPHLVFLVLGLGLAAFGMYGLAILSLVLWVGVLALSSMRAAIARTESDPREEMGAESRSLFSPIRRLTHDIEEIVEKESNSTIMGIVGKEAAVEARRIHDQVAKALSVRDDLKKSLREKNVSRMEAESLKSKAEAESDPTVKVTLLSAYEARQTELGHYKVVEETIAKIDASVRQAEAALSEMKARLATKASGEKALSATDDDDLRETIGRMKALSISYDEAEQMLRG